MTEKKWWESKAVWGGLIAVGAGIAGVFGFAVSAEEQEAIAGAITALASAIGGALAVYGRIKANSGIK